jgi:hypothetical protein
MGSLLHVIAGRPACAVISARFGTFASYLRGETPNATRISWNWLKITARQVNRGPEFGFFDR